MERQLPYAEIKEIDENTIEVCYFEGPGKMACRSWKLSIQEATNIAEWWKYEGHGLTAWHTPIKNRQVGDIVVSMFSPERVCVRMIDQYGRVNINGCSLPSNVVRHLAAWVR